MQERRREVNIRKTRGERTPAEPVIIDEVICQEFVELVTDYLEGALPEPKLSQVEEHLVICKGCRAYLAQVESTVLALAELTDGPGPEPPEWLLAALRANSAR
jgi:predicted anti-sigma-YlaC factor YlaD